MDSMDYRLYTIYIYKNTFNDIFPIFGQPIFSKREHFFACFFWSFGCHHFFETLLISFLCVWKIGLISACVDDVDFVGLSILLWLIHFSTPEKVVSSLHQYHHLDQLYRYANLWSWQEFWWYWITSWITSVWKLGIYVWK